MKVIRRWGVKQWPRPDEGEHGVLRGHVARNND
jgi:hypothetical protein